MRNELQCRSGRIILTTVLRDSNAKYNGFPGTVKASLNPAVHMSGVLLEAY